ncbi:MAG: DinB family protein [Nodularia sp. CChRGM 3473]
MFNHQTHHRSQITSELHKMGIDYGCTDLPYNPYNESKIYVFFP